MTPMTKTQIYFPEEDLEALHETARRTGKSVAQLVREAVRQVWMPPAENRGPVGLWNKRAKKTSVEHDSIYDNP